MFTLAIDCDEVLINLVKPWINELNKIYNKNYKFNDIKDWSFSELYGIDVAKALEVLNESKFYKNVKPIKNAANALDIIRRSDIDIKIVSATPVTAISSKFNKIMVDLNIYESELVFTYDKSIITCNAMIDDNINNLIDNPYPKYKLLFTRPWNVNINKTYITRVSSWTSIMDWLVTKNLIPNELYLEYIQKEWD